MLNPITYTEKIVGSFLKYQLTAYPFSDPRLHAQMRELLNLDRVRQTPLLRGPYVSLSRSFRQGGAVAALTAEGVFHPHLRQIIPAGITHLYGHQEQAIRTIKAGRTTLVGTGTGSGKTECFLYPIIDACLELRDRGGAPGIGAVVVYPMNALAEDQLDRLRSLLAGSGISFGMYIGKTPEHEREVTGHRMPAGSSRADYQEVLERYRGEGRPDVVHPAEEVCSRERMRTPGCQPRILLTNVKQLELLLTRGADVELFDGARLDYLVFDEAHTFGGLQGAETACLIRRLRAFCGGAAGRTVCVATSATIADADDPEAARTFASRFFGVDAGSVECVSEEYEADLWPDGRELPAAPAEPGGILAQALAALEKGESAGDELRALYARLAGKQLGTGDWPAALHEALGRNELAYLIRKALDTPKGLRELAAELTAAAGREVGEEEVVAYLAMGAAAVADNRPIFRPVVHAFVRGIPGAVVSFPHGDEPKLWLSGEDEIAAQGGEDRMWRPPVHTCTTCGQHYFVTFLSDFKFTGGEPEGGQLADGGATFWEKLDAENGGCRAVLLDRVIGGEEDADLGEEKWSCQLFFCRHCGAAHAKPSDKCLGCGMDGLPVKLFAVKSNPKNAGRLGSCVSCMAKGRSLGGGYREPMRPVRAVNVSDVHVLAQDMVHHAERRRLLLFADNRQDAAFQAGWMKDHARRFRLRRLMAETMQPGAISVGDMVYQFDARLEGDDDLSRALIPEVWRVIQKEGGGAQHQQERRRFLRLQVLREVATAANQQKGLEPWGRLKVTYHGLTSGARFIQEWARRLGLPPDDLRGGVEALLDQLRRQRLLDDAETKLFTRWWGEGDPDIQRGYLPSQPGPQGMKLRLDGDDDKRYVRAWMTERNTLIREIARKWGVPDDDIPDFLEALWNWLSPDGLGILKPVNLRSSKGSPLPKCSGVFQIDAGLLMLNENHGYYRCKRCRRKVSRHTPHGNCMAWQCDGELEFIGEEADNYDLQLLDNAYSMIRPEEHTAMLPADQREKIENWFKGDGERVNALVCTPTLELGVDIGALDAVLLRNVPPLPANYWQRAGRAGRRHRMAVNVTYCRSASHDRAYYSEPLKMLDGKVDPPAFNLRNDVMVAKHVHATAITRLFELSRGGSGGGEEEGRRIAKVLASMLPRQISSYLFDRDGRVREAPFDLAPLRELLVAQRDNLLRYVDGAFANTWPPEDAAVVSAAELARHVDGMAAALGEVIARLRKRLRWAHGEIRRLNRMREEFGDLDPQDEAHYRRCDRMLKKLKGTGRFRRREAEGVDDINTYGVLAAEGFLPGYGLDTGTVVGMAEVPYWLSGSMEFELPRPPGMALREYVPGNLIYANGHRFVARRFHREAEEERLEQPLFEVNIAREAIAESRLGEGTQAMDSSVLRAISVCDVVLIHVSQISDEEDNRFQMPMAVYGREKGRHGGGARYGWGEKELTLRRNVHLRMVNVGANPAIEQRNILGYPVCSVCGQSVSPLSSERQIESFAESHRERCGRRPEFVGFFTDVVADCLTLPACADRQQAYTILEALRLGASQIMDMHRQDLQVLVVGHVDRGTVDAILWDPMPGGSGILQQLVAHFAEVVAQARSVVAGCPSVCDKSCIDCLQDFRNSYYHRYLDRHACIEILDALGDTLEFEHEIPAMEPTSGTIDHERQPVNDGETRLKHLLESAGFTDGTFQQRILFDHPIVVDRALGSTTPDVFFAGDEDDEEDRGVCIYLDGLSAALHGDPQIAARDQAIRTWLRNNGYQVIEISCPDLTDRGAMTRHFRKLARYVSGREMASQVGSDDSWFAPAAAPATATPSAPPPELLDESQVKPFLDALPFYDLQAAAGAFGDGQTPELLGWVKTGASRKLDRRMFVAQVVGDSMRPKIPNGACCIFRTDVAGTRQGRILLVGHDDIHDPEVGGHYTVKEYHSEKTARAGEGWEHVKITLKPRNPDYQPIVVEPADEGAVRAVAEFVDLL